MTTDEPPYIKIIDDGIKLIVNTPHKPDAGKTIHIYLNGKWVLSDMDDMSSFKDDKLRLIHTVYEGDKAQVSIFLAEYGIMGIVDIDRFEGILSPVILVPAAHMVGTIDEVYQKTGMLPSPRVKQNAAELGSILNKEEAKGVEPDLSDFINKPPEIDGPVLYDGEPIDM